MDGADEGVVAVVAVDLECVVDERRVDACDRQTRGLSRGIGYLVDFETRHACVQGERGRCHGSSEVKAVVATAALDRFSRREVPVADPEDIVTSAADEGVPAGAADQNVTVTGAFEPVVSCVSDQRETC